MKKIDLKLVFTFSLLASMLSSYGQTIPVTPFSFDQDLRVLQLQGNLPLEHSMNVRPISFSKKFTADSLYNLIGGKGNDNFKERKVDFWKGHGKLALLPVTTITKYTSHHPFGWSDGALMPSNGFQQIISAGFYAAIGPLSLQIKPEFLNVQNSNYETTILFGKVNPGGNIKKFLLGQSRAALNVGPLSLALSSENIWVGPGQYSSLIMSNNASGFKHISVSTRRPIKNILGSLEFQIIGGQLLGGDLESEDVYNLRSFKEYTYGYRDTNTYTKKYSKYLNAITINYTPSFFKNLNIGITRSFIASFGDVNSNILKRTGFLSAYLPVFEGLFKENRIGFEDSIQWNQLASIYARFIFQKANAEVYFEYGWNDHKFNLRDMLMSTTHSSAFIVGIKKIIELQKSSEIDFNIEINIMAPSADNLVRDAGSWYIHWNKSNYSNSGQVLGSGIGFSSNALVFSTTLKKRYNQLGFIFSCIQQNPAFTEVKWSDYQFGLQSRKKINSFLVNARLSGIHSNNYGWENGKNRFNIMGMLGISYFF